MFRCDPIASRKAIIGDDLVDYRVTLHGQLLYGTPITVCLGFGPKDKMLIRRTMPVCSMANLTFATGVVKGPKTGRFPGSTGKVFTTEPARGPA